MTKVLDQLQRLDTLFQQALLMAFVYECLRVGLEWLAAKLLRSNRYPPARLDLKLISGLQKV